MMMILLLHPSRCRCQLLRVVAIFDEIENISNFRVCPLFSTVGNQLRSGVRPLGRARRYVTVMQGVV